MPAAAGRGSGAQLGLGFYFSEGTDSPIAQHSLSVLPTACHSWELGPLLSQPLPSFWSPGVFLPSLLEVTASAGSDVSGSLLKKKDLHGNRFWLFLNICIKKEKKELEILRICLSASFIHICQSPSSRHYSFWLRELEEKIKWAVLKRAKDSTSLTFSYSKFSHQLNWLFSWVFHSDCFIGCLVLQNKYMCRLGNSTVFLGKHHINLTEKANVFNSNHVFLRVLENRHCKCQNISHYFSTWQWEISMCHLRHMRVSN